MLSTRKLVAIGALLAVAASGIAFAQTMPDHHSMGPDQQQMMQSGPNPMGSRQMQEMMRQHQGMVGAHAGMHATSTTPTMPGQGAFGAIQEVVQILDADPKTDWSKGRSRSAAAASHRHERGDAEGRRLPESDRRGFADRGHRHRAHARRDPADGPRLGADNERLSGVEHERCLLADRRASHRHRDRSEGNPAYSRSRLYWPIGERLASSASPSRDGKGRIRSRTFEPHALRHEGGLSARCPEGGRGRSRHHQISGFRILR
jgi:hypothetical protein